MPETIQCPQCHRTLQVQEAHLGKKVRCPSCQGVFEAVPMAQAAPEVPAEEEVRSVSEFEVPEERPAPRRRREQGAFDFSNVRDEDEELVPHRGGSILTFGILSIVLACAPVIGGGLAIVALSWASADLPRMRRKTMDPAGRGMTRAGQVCGTIGLILSAACLVLACLLKIGR